MESQAKATASHCWEALSFTQGFKTSKSDPKRLPRHRRNNWIIFFKEHSVGARLRLMATLNWRKTLPMKRSFRTHTTGSSMELLSNYALRVTRGGDLQRDTWGLQKWQAERDFNPDEHWSAGSKQTAILCWWNGHDKHQSWWRYRLPSRYSCHLQAVQYPCCKGKQPGPTMSTRLHLFYRQRRTICRLHQPQEKYVQVWWRLQKFIKRTLPNILQTYVCWRPRQKWHLRL